MKKRKTLRQQVAIYLALCIETRDTGRAPGLWNIRLLSLTPVILWIHRLWIALRRPRPASRRASVGPVGRATSRLKVQLILIRIGLNALIWGLKPT